MKAGHRQAVGFAVEVGDQIAALAHEGAREVDVAPALHIEAVLRQINAQALMQQPALADQPRPAVHLHALQQPQGDRLIAGVELLDPAAEGGAGDLGFVPGLGQAIQTVGEGVAHQLSATP